MERFIHPVQYISYSADYCGTTPDCPNFLNKQDNHFRHLQGTLDALFHKLHSGGIGMQVRHTEIITKADEEKLWASGVMGV